jgi:regulator of protease activity HflC (stomatin/prohibitin superfamily)
MNVTSLFFLFFVGIAVLVIAKKTVVVTNATERVVVFRLGRFFAVRPLGVVLVVPFIDKVVKVRIEQIDGWERMSEDQLLERIAEIYQTE